MKKMLSLIKACMTSDMSLFKIKTKNNGKSKIILPIFIAIYLMFMIWSFSNIIFEKINNSNLSYILLSLSIFSISIMTFIEGIYKSSSLIFNCKDDEILLSLPIKRRTVLFIRIFKFYLFELLFNSLFLIPVMISYIRWESITWTYYLSCFVMLILSPIIPIILSCIVGVFTSSLSSKFKYKNVSQIIITMIILVLFIYVSFQMEDILNYIIIHATSINDIITKIYYPAGVFAKLITNFNVIDLISFILINITIFVLSIYILSKFYFKINSRIKSVTTISNKKNNIDKLIIKSNSKVKSLIKKEITTFYKIPVFIINAGFSLVLFIIMTIVIIIKFDIVIPLLTSEETGLGLTKDLILNNTSVLVFVLIAFTSFMTSITNSVISIEGKSINILKSLPIKTETILLSKVFASSVITTPILVIGTIMLFIKFKFSFIELLLLLALSILIPLVSHFIGIIVNLKYPKFDWENASEVVKQSTSSFISVMMGMLLLIITVIVVINVVGNVTSTLILTIALLIFLIIDAILYLYLINIGVKKFNKLGV